MSRRKNRYKRRMAERAEKRAKYLANNLSFDNMNNYQALYDAIMSSSLGVSWKESVQKVLETMLFYIADLSDDLAILMNFCLGFYHFYKCERGKTRKISSVKYKERIVQKVLCQQIMTPVMTYNLIYDNGASQKGKGTLFATKRLTKHLMKYYKKYGNQGYALLIDFKSYFENIQHQPLKDNLRQYIKDERILKYAEDFIDAFGDKGLGLGSETSQINAISYVNKIDHFIKEKAREKFYGRYMDDSYIIHPSKEHLRELLAELQAKYDELGIKLNTKKTVIVKLSRGFTFLKTRFYITDSGKILRKPCRAAITRVRRKLKKQAKLYYKGELDLQSIRTSFASWVGSMHRRQARKTIYYTKKLYKELFEKGDKNDKND